jgi:hypothetical protein
VHVPVNGAFNAAHVISNTATFVPLAFDLTASFTPAGGEARVLHQQRQVTRSRPLGRLGA